MSAAEDMAPAELVGEVRELRGQVAELSAMVRQLLRRRRAPRRVPSPEPVEPVEEVSETDRAAARAAARRLGLVVREPKR